jgi:ubiquinone/menaquinone biosynthesis C-methylase UbiE
MFLAIARTILRDHGFGHETITAMLTVDFRRLPVTAGIRVLDVGCGSGRHAFEAYRRGADVVALDQDVVQLERVAAMFEALRQAGEAPPYARAEVMKGDALALPFDDEWFDVVVAAEILEHVPDDAAAMREITRVLCPGGVAAVTVPRWFPEAVCWALSREYHTVEGGHVRIYRHQQLADRLTAAGLRPYDHHHAHALHSPYWWLRCALRDHPIPRLYHRLLVWDIVHRPRVTRLAEQVLNPLIGKSLVVYVRKPQHA